MSYAIPSLRPSAPMQMTLKVIAVAVAGASSGIETGSAIAGIVGGFIALATIALLLRQNTVNNRRQHEKELADKRSEGRADRDDEVRELMNRVNDLNSRLDAKDRDIDFYRNQYATLLQVRAGANQVALPPLNPRPHPEVNGG